MNADFTFIKAVPVGLKSKRRGGASSIPEEIERAEWYRKVEEEAFRKAKDLELIGGGDATEDKSGENFDQTDSRLGIDIQGKESDSESKEKMADDLLKPKFSNFLLDLGEESAAKKEAEAKVKKGGVPKPPIENYTRAAHFNAKKWLVKLADVTPPIKSRLICFHGLGGCATSFHHWAQHLRSVGVEVYAVQLPGRGSRVLEAKVVSMFQIVRSLRDAFKDLDLLGEHFTNIRGEVDINIVPTVFFGHSVGALIAYELLLCLEHEMSQEELESTPIFLRYKPFRLQHFVVSSCRAPGIATQFNMDRFTTKYFCASQRDLLERYIEMAAVPPHLKDRNDLLSGYFDIFRNDYELMEKYIYWREPSADPSPIACAMTLVGAADDNTVSEKHLKEWFLLSSKPAGAHICFREGGCYYMSLLSNQETLLRAIRIICQDGHQSANASTSEGCITSLQEIACFLAPPVVPNW